MGVSSVGRDTLVNIIELRCYHGRTNKQTNKNNIQYAYISTPPLRLDC